MVSFCGFFGRLLRLLSLTPSYFMVGMGYLFMRIFLFLFHWGTGNLFSRDFLQAPKDRCGVASGGLGDWGTSVIGRGAWSSFLVVTILGTSVQWKLFGDTPPWVAVGLLTSLGILHSYGPTSRIGGLSFLNAWRSLLLEGLRVYGP